ncbi:MAG: inositol monophosphatase family protein [Candidatus Helarchaeota archaeon]
MMWINILSKAVLKSSLEIKKYFGTSKSLGFIGAGGDIVKEIDKKVEDCIISYLKSEIKNFNLVSEEVGELYFGSNSSDYIVLDPIDGSTNATRGVPFFCVSIAHFDDKSIKNLKNGVIYNWVTGDIYRAIKNKGATKNNVKIKCSSEKILNNSVISYDIDPSNLEGDYESLKKVIKHAGKLRHMGSAALELALVSEGAFDGYIDLRNKLRLVDIAAGILLVQEAGGMVINELGKEIEIPIGIDSHTSICAINKHLTAEITAFLKK